MIQDLWKTISKYPRFFISFSLGIFFNALSPLAPLLKRPVTAIALVGVFIGGLAFLSFTLRAMLGLNPV